MRANTAQVLKWIGLSEGGYVNNPKDPGGATDRGITQRTYDAWNKLHGRPPRPVRGISKAEADRVIVNEYLRPIRFDDLPPGLDYAVADFSVNSGPSRAAKYLQQTLGGLDVDGIIGSKTLAAAQAADQRKLVNDYLDRRLAFLRVAKHPRTGALLWDTFGDGWRARVKTVRGRALTLVGPAVAPVETPAYDVVPEDITDPPVTPTRPEDTPKTGADEDELPAMVSPRATWQTYGLIAAVIAAAVFAII